MLRSTLTLALIHSSLALATGPACDHKTGERPFPSREAGTSNEKMPIEHIVILMQENHSFDNYFGQLNKGKFYGAEIDGVNSTMTNSDSNGSPIHAYHETSHCEADPEHDWSAIHREWNRGAMDGFVKTNGANAMGYFDESDIPFYYDLANKFSVSDRHFCSALTQTFPNRFYLYTGTSFGHIANDIPIPIFGFGQQTIFNVLNQYGISWKYYRAGPGYLALFQPLFLSGTDKIGTLDDYHYDLAHGNLPSVVLLDAFPNEDDEHPNANIQEGQAFVADQLSALVRSRYWRNSVFFLTYDEGGGFFDHVAPPKACVPDQIKPNLQPGDYHADFDRYGIRVPFVAISPFAKHHYVSHRTQDHTSILKFIEMKFNLPALTDRDANADDLLSMFDWKHPDYETVPNFSLATVDGTCD